LTAISCRTLRLQAAAAVPVGPSRCFVIKCRLGVLETWVLVSRRLETRFYKSWSWSRSWTSKSWSWSWSWNCWVLALVLVLNLGVFVLVLVLDKQVLNPSLWNTVLHEKQCRLSGKANLYLSGRIECLAAGASRKVDYRATSDKALDLHVGLRITKSKSDSNQCSHLLKPSSPPTGTSRPTSFTPARLESFLHLWSVQMVYVKCYCLKAVI